MKPARGGGPSAKGPAETKDFNGLLRKEMVLWAPSVVDFTVTGPKVRACCRQLRVRGNNEVPCDVPTDPDSNFNLNTFSGGDGLHPNYVGDYFK